MACRIDRRSFLGKSVAAGAAFVGIQSVEEKKLLAMLENPSEKDRLKEGAEDAMPMGKIKDVKISRLIAGGNIISGWCHQRDLLYVSTLAGHYLTEEKQFDTLELYEEHGINTCSPDPSQMGFISKYKRERGGEIQTIVGCHEDWDYFNNPAWKRLKQNIDESIDAGGTMMYTQGGYTEHVMKTGDPKKIEIIAKAIEYIKEQGYPAGLGCHDIKVIQIADKYGIEPDYYFKTLHHDKYWSAQPREHREHWSVDSTLHLDHNKFHDNIYDLFPENTIALMAKKKQPWIAFKTLAAGAIHPESAFEFCFKNGADFITVGMFDFQIVEDTIIARETLASDEVKDRSRRWCA
ncbi:MAG: hypothetical protein JW741_14575 [Sedimentisphaerales bacterium]|nr:hypothetical protein [Sedimentisphaerales bacterium]